MPGGRGRRFVRWTGWLLLAAVAALSTWAFAPRSGDGSGEAFAVWPEDDPRDARRECVQHLIDQPWRLSSAGVKRRFTEKTLGLSKTDDFIAAVALERLGPCWYVTHSSPREGYADINIGHRWEGDDLLAVVDWRGHGSADVELGFGGQTMQRAPTDRPAEFRFEDVKGPGHVIVRFGAGGSYSEMYAHSVPLPPPHPTTQLVPAPESDVRPVAGEGDRACRRRYSLGFAWTSAPRGSLLGLKRELQAGRGSLSGARFIRRGEDWIFEVHEARLRVDVDRIGECYRVIRVEPIEQDLDVQIAKDHRRISLLFDWLEADTAYIQASDGFYYLRKTDLPLTFYASTENLATPDYVLLALYEEDRLYSAIAYEVTS